MDPGVRLPEARARALRTKNEVLGKRATAGKNVFLLVLASAVADQVDINTRVTQAWEDRRSDSSTHAVLTILDRIARGRPTSYGATTSTPTLSVAHWWERMSRRWKATQPMYRLYPDYLFNYGQDLHTLAPRTADVTDPEGVGCYEGDPRKKKAF